MALETNFTRSMLRYEKSGIQISDIIDVFATFLLLSRSKVMYQSVLLTYDVHPFERLIIKLGVCPFHMLVEMT